MVEDIRHPHISLNGLIGKRVLSLRRSVLRFVAVMKQLAINQQIFLQPPRRLQFRQLHQLRQIRQKLHLNHLQLQLQHYHRLNFQPLDVKHWSLVIVIVLPLMVQQIVV